MDCIAVPLLKGSLDDAVRQGDSESGTNSNSTSLILERENRYNIYSTFAFICVSVYRKRAY